LKTNLSSAYAYSHVRIFGNLAYFYNNYAGTGAELVYNTATNSNVRSEFITDGTVVTATYGINIDEENGDVYLMDAKNFSTAGEVFCFNSTGAKKFSFSVSPGVNPNKVVFNR
jgi:myo-inositol-hexaphosphate 3-phosphohydrolase